MQSGQHMLRCWSSNRNIDLTGCRKRNCLRHPVHIGAGERKRGAGTDNSSSTWGYPILPPTYPIDPSAFESNDALLAPADIQRAAKGCASSEMCSELENQ